MSDTKTITERWENGQKRSEVHYKDGELDGKQTWWYKNGQKSSEVHFGNGDRHGKATWWYEDGNIERERHFKDGKMETQKETTQ
jgi:antitoxin component YwqK of YwqJK toxin-antitoxin module